MEPRIRNILKNSPDPLQVRKTTAEVLDKLQLIKVDYDKIQEFAKIVKKRSEEKKVLDSDQFGSEDPTAQLVFVLDASQFCFWAFKDKEKWKVEFPPGIIIEGGWDSFVACFERAKKEDIPVLDAEYLRKMTVKDGEKIFRSATSTRLILLDKRIEILNEIGSILLEKYGGKIDNLIDKTGLDAAKIIKSIVADFPSFDDHRDFDGKRINFFKRVQIFTYDLSMLPAYNIKNLSCLTSFADYKVPQMLRLFGLMEYKKPLAGKVDNYILVEEGSREEIEIRAATVWVCELIANEIGLNPVLIDNILWVLSQEYRHSNIKPYHRTITTSY